MDFNLDKTDVTNQIYQMALTYVATHEDMKNMSPDEFCKKCLMHKENSHLSGEIIELSKCIFTRSNKS